MNDMISNRALDSLHKIEQLESHFLELPQTECPVVHSFYPGIYIRQVTIPADTFSIGHYQKTRHLNVLLRGRVTMVADDGSLVELVAPQQFESGPGRKVGYIHEEMVWLNVYATDETDVTRLEEIFLEKSEPFLLHQQQLALVADRINPSGYQQMLAELGVTEELVTQQSENETDQIPLPPGSYTCQVGLSPIHGKGLFATSLIKPGDIIAPARLGGKRTPAGRYTNHSDQPNAKMLLCGSDIMLVSVSSINGSKGGQLGEEITVDYRQAVNETLKEPSP